MKDEGLKALDEKMKTMPDEYQMHKFLGVEQADGIKMKEVYSRVKEEISRTMNITTVKQYSRIK